MSRDGSSPIYISKFFFGFDNDGFMFEDSADAFGVFLYPFLYIVTSSVSYNDSPTQSADSATKIFILQYDPYINALRLKECWTSVRSTTHPSLMWVGRTQQDEAIYYLYP